MIAADVMTRDVAVVREEAEIADAVRLMLDRGISGVPVLDDDHHLVGMLTEGDLLRRSELHTEKHRSRWLELLLGKGSQALEYVRAHGRKVREVMTREVVTAGPGTPLGNLVGLMEKHRVKRVPIVRDRDLVGIVTRADLLRALAACLPAAPEPTVVQGDKQIRQRILAALQDQGWAPRTGLDIDVEGGVVWLRGIVFDDRLRGALKVAAENVPGVRAVRDELVSVEPSLGLAMISPGEGRGQNVG